MNNVARLQLLGVPIPVERSLMSDREKGMKRDRRPKECPFMRCALLDVPQRALRYYRRMNGLRLVLFRRKRQELVNAV